MSEKFIKNILDVPGVEGVCVFDAAGRVLYNELPPYFIEELFDDLSRRIASLYETVDENFIPCDDYLLKYSERWIFLRRGQGTYILVFAVPSVNRVSLKMVTNLAVKNLKPSTISIPPGATAPVAVQPGASPAALPPVQTEPPAQFVPPTAEPEPVPDESAPMRKRVARPRPKRSFRGSSY